jgi:FtsP/CotA-like multicopper oxidase with cupredoxin domain
MTRKASLVFHAPRKEKNVLKKQGSIAVAALAGVFMAALSFNAALSAPKSIMVSMKALNGSKQNGSAVFTQLPKGVRVVVTLSNAPATAEPTHVHAGTCAAPNPAPAFALKDTVNGKSTTFIPDVRLDAFSKDVVLVHESLKNLSVYVSCGEIL